MHNYKYLEMSILIIQSMVSQEGKQFSFCKNISSLQQLLLYFDDLCSSKKQTDCVYLDFSKAFDT